MTSWCIVAIPSENDYTWKVSSETVPHITLLFLGEQDGNPNAQKMADFIEHVANTTLDRFGLNVDHRGLLGADDADVLFFGDHNIEELKSFRTTLLQDQDILEAYNSTEQFPEWTPHLTLGYPETPAKPDERDQPGIYWVFFDRIALWTEDSSGYEFLLKEKELSMSDITVDGILKHYGVPGMKWGKSGPKTKSSVSNVRTALLGTIGNGSHRYKDPEALRLRKASGKKFIASAILSVGANVVSTLGKNSPGSMAVAGVLGTAASGVGIASLVQAFQANGAERRSEQK